MSAVRAFTLAMLCLTGCGTATAPSGAAPTARDPHHPLASPQPTLRSPSPAPTCSGGTLLTTEPPDAAMGLRAQTVTLTNCGDEVRHVSGYPRVRLLDETGDPLDVRIDEGAQEVTIAIEDPGPRKVTLRPGRSARFALVWRNTYTDISRPPALGTTLVLAGHRVESHVDLGSTGLLGVTAWEPVAAR